MNLKPIVIDLEASGLGMEKSGIWQIGAVDLNTMEEFLEEARIDDNDEIVNLPESKYTFEEICGKTEEDVRDPNKQSQEELLKRFFKWVGEKQLKNFVCQNPQFDMAFLWLRAQKYGMKKTFGYRAFDLHTIAQIKFHELHDKFSVNKEKGKSDLDLSNILKFCGFIDDPRTTHNALEDAKLTAECFSRLVYGKKLLPEYAQFKIPEVLRK